MRKLLLLGGGLLFLGDIMRPTRKNIRQPKRVRPIIPPRVMTEAQLNTWAAQMGTTPAHAVLMAMISSERPGLRQSHRAEQLAIMSTAINRSRWPSAFGVGAVGQSPLWRVIVGMSTTGKQGGKRHYATSRPPADGASILHYHALADEVLSGAVTTDATHFHHWPNAQRRDYIRQRRHDQGYGLVGVPGVAQNADFFAPYDYKVAGFNRAEGLV
jgi:hypothetical protein